MVAACFISSWDLLSADIISYTSKAAFLSAESGTSLESFESLANRQLSQSDITTTNFTIKINAGTANISSTGSGGHGPTDGVKYSNVELNALGKRRITFVFAIPQTTFAIAVTDFGDYGPGPGNLTINTNVGSPASGWVVATNPPVRADGNVLFFGFRQSVPFTQVTLETTTTQDGIGIDEIRSRTAMPAELFQGAAETAGLSGEDAMATATPRFDGTANLLKYAFNMSLVAPDTSVLVEGSGSRGLPAIRYVSVDGNGFLRLEYVRRKNSGLTYTPWKSTNLSPGSWLPLSSVPVFSTIDDSWERVVYLESMAAGEASGFGRVDIALP
jgi:hypothetical protein